MTHGVARNVTDGAGNRKQYIDDKRVSLYGEDRFMYTLIIATVILVRT